MAIKRRRTSRSSRCPSDPHVMHQWRQNSAESQRPIKAKYKICARHFVKHPIFDGYYREHEGSVLVDVKRMPRLRKEAVSPTFKGRLARLNDDECQDQQEDADAKGREEINLSKTTRSIGAFPSPDTCRNENSEPCLGKDSFSWRMAGIS